MPKPTIPAHIREQQINDLPNISFLRWDGPYRGAVSKAFCRCEIDGYEWSSRAKDLIHNRRGCPQCAGVRRWTADERIVQINAIPNVSFIGWASEGYRNCYSKATVRCSVDGFEWASGVTDLLNGKGCPQCAGNRRWGEKERIQQINELRNVSFVRWADTYKNQYSKAICRCILDGFEWSASVSHLVTTGTGCPSCAKSGYDQTKAGTLYVLRSVCGTMVKIGISNNYVRRHRELKHGTPFDWACTELIHGGGSVIAELEKELHSKTEPVQFAEKFDGHTEWRKWAPEIPKLIQEIRCRVAP